VGLLCTAGLLNGIFGQGESRHIAHWQSVKLVDKTEEQSEDGTVTIREKERWANELNVALATRKGRNAQVTACFCFWPRRGTPYKTAPGIVFGLYDGGGG